MEYILGRIFKCKLLEDLNIHFMQGISRNHSYFPTLRAQKHLKFQPPCIKNKYIKHNIHFGTRVCTGREQSKGVQPCPWNVRHFYLIYSKNFSDYFFKSYLKIVVFRGCMLTPWSRVYVVVKYIF